MSQQTSSPQPQISSPSHQPPQHCPQPHPAWIGAPRHVQLDSMGGSIGILMYAQQAVHATYLGPPPPLVRQYMESSKTSMQGFVWSLPQVTKNQVAAGRKPPKEIWVSDADSSPNPQFSL